MKKKTISLALTLVMVQTLIPVTASAASVLEKIENTYPNAIPISAGQ